MYYLMVGCWSSVSWGRWLHVRTKFGRVLTAIRDNEYRVLALGYNTAMYKTFVFALPPAWRASPGACTSRPADGRAGRV